MTQPTQAQIEAAAKAICDYRHYPDMEAWINLGGLQDDYRMMAKAALTAVAKVGEHDAQQPSKLVMERDAALSEVERLKMQLAHEIKVGCEAEQELMDIIERCAQVAEGFSIGLGEYNGATIAAAIRKLKDAPCPTS